MHAFCSNLVNFLLVSAVYIRLDNVMQVEDLEALLAATFTDAEIQVVMEGSHFNIQIVSDAFEGLMPVKKQQMVYAVINEKIADGSMHAVNMKLYIPEQWAKIKA